MKKSLFWVLLAAPLLVACTDTYDTTPSVYVQPSPVVHFAPVFIPGTHTTRTIYVNRTPSSVSTPILSPSKPSSSWWSSSSSSVRSTPSTPSYSRGWSSSSSYGSRGWSSSSSSRGYSSSPSRSSSSRGWR